MENSYDAAIIGAGAAGLFAAGVLAGAGLKVALIEKKRPAAKVMLTGKGRCNLTNNCEITQFMENVVTNPRFLYSSLSAFTPADTMNMFEKLGVELKTERGGRVFPCSDKALDIVHALEKHAEGAALVKGQAVALLQRGGAVSAVRLAGGAVVNAKCVLLACGGCSYPQTGSDGTGWVLAKQAGHTVVPAVSSLCGIECAGKLCGQLQGLTLKNVELVCTEKNGGKTLFRQRGELLFTQSGISGPLALTLSAYINRREMNELAICVDLKPALDETTLDARLLRDFSLSLNREFKNSLDALLPRSLVPVIVEQSGIDAECRVNAVTAAQRERLVKLLKHLPLQPVSLESIDRAVVTSGGVSTAQIQPKTMMSRLVSGLFFAGEVIDVDALTGGYSLQIAFSTANAAAHAIIEYCAQFTEE